MANVITTILKLDGNDLRTGLSRVRTDMAAADTLTGKLKAGWAGVSQELRTNRELQLGVAAGAATAAAVSVKAASDLAESVNAVNVQYGLAGDEVLALGETSSTAFGMSKRAFNEFAVQFSAFAQQIAPASGQSVEDVVGGMATRLADFASVHNLTMEEAAQVAQSTLAGETESFRRFGGDVSAAAVELYALRTGLVDNKNEMTEAIKVQARYGLFMEQTAKVAGDFANTQDSLANQQRIAMAQAEDLAAQLGQVLIPVFAEATQAANEYAAGLQNIIDKAGAVPGMDTLLGDDASDVAGRLRQAWDLTGIVSGARAGEFAVKGLTEVTNRLGNAFGFGSDKAEEFANAAGQVRDRIRDTQQQQQTYLAQLEGQYVTAHRAAKEALEAAAAAQDRYIDGLVRAHEAARDGMGGLRDEAFRLGSTLEDLADKFDKSGDKADDASVGIEKYDGALADLAVTLDKVQNNLDGMNSALDAQSEQLDLADAIDSVEEAESRLAEAVAEHGANSEEADDAQRDLTRAVIRYNEEVLDLLGTLDGVPTSKLTEIKVAMAQGDVDRVEELLAEITRDRTIKATVVPVKQNAFEQAIIQIGTGGVAPSGPTYTNPTPAPAAAPSGTTYMDNSRTTIVYPVGHTPRTTRTDRVIDDRRNGIR